MAQPNPHKQPIHQTTQTEEPVLTHLHEVHATPQDTPAKQDRLFSIPWLRPARKSAASAAEAKPSKKAKAKLNRWEWSGKWIAIYVGSIVSPTWILAKDLFAQYVNFEAFTQGGQEAIAEYIRFNLYIMKHPEVGNELFFPVLGLTLLNLVYLGLCGRAGTWAVRQGRQSWAMRRAEA